MPKVKVEAPKGSFIETTTVREGTYIGLLKAVKEGTLNWNGEERRVFRWFFVILDKKFQKDDGTIDYATVEGLTSDKFTTRSNAYKWWSTLMGRKPAIGEEVELEDAIGHVAQIVVKNKTSKSGRTYSRVVDVVPVPEGMKKYVEQLIETYENSIEDEDYSDADVEEEEPIETEEETEEEPEEVIVPKKPKKKSKKVAKLD